MPNFQLSDQVFLQAAEQFETPFHLYSEELIRATVRRLYRAFSKLPSYKEYFAVKALPNPSILRILKQEGCGVDCASLTELMLSDACGFSGDEIMFSANDVPKREFMLALKLDATVNLDDATHLDALCIAAEGNRLPEELCLRYNPGGTFQIGNAIMGNPGEAKFGMTRGQLSDVLRELRNHHPEVKRFGLHAFLSSNTTDPQYYPLLAKILFQTGRELMEESGLPLSFINLSGGIGIPYQPEESEADIEAIGDSVARVYEQEITKQGLPSVAVKSELGRYMTGPNGWLVTHILHRKNTHRTYFGLDASACDLMRPAMYGAYHHITLPGKTEGIDHAVLCDITGNLCENNDKFAVNRILPNPQVGDVLVIHDTGAHGLSMGYNYNGKLRCKEVLHCMNGSFRLIRREERPRDYFAALDGDEVYKKMKERYPQDW